LPGDGKLQADRDARQRACAERGIEEPVELRQGSGDRILVDGRGDTLYLFAKDRNGQSACSGSCAGYWPPLIAVGKPRAGAGVTVALLGTTRRADGRLQITYRHHPLYTYVSDTSKGQTNGQGLDASGGKWWAVSPAGNKITKSGSGTTMPADPAYGGYGTTIPADPGYGY